MVRKVRAACSTEVEYADLWPRRTGDLTRPMPNLVKVALPFWTQFPCP